jgi:hypothetical protein
MCITFSGNPFTPNDSTHKSNTHRHESVRDHGSGHRRLRDGIASRRKGREIDEWTTISQKVVLSVTTDRVTLDCVMESRLAEKDVRSMNGPLYPKRLYFP